MLLVKSFFFLWQLTLVEVSTTPKAAPVQRQGDAESTPADVPDGHIPAATSAEQKDTPPATIATVPDTTAVSPDNRSEPQTGQSQKTAKPMSMTAPAPSSPVDQGEGRVSPDQVDGAALSAAMIVSDQVPKEVMSCSDV